MYSVRTTTQRDKRLFLQCAQASCHRSLDLDALAIGWDRYWEFQIHAESRLSYVAVEGQQEVGLVSISLVHNTLYDKIAAVDNLQDYFALSYLSEDDYLNENELSMANTTRSVVAFVDAMVWSQPRHFMPLIDTAVQCVRGLHVGSLLFAPLKPQLQMVFSVLRPDVISHLGRAFVGARVHKRMQYARNQFFTTVRVDRDPKKDVYGNRVERVFEPSQRPEELERFNLSLRLRRYLQSMQSIRNEQAARAILGVSFETVRSDLRSFEPPTYEGCTPFVRLYRDLTDPEAPNAFARFESLRTRAPSLKFPVLGSR